VNHERTYYHDPRRNVAGFVEEGEVREFPAHNGTGVVDLSRVIPVASEAVFAPLVWVTDEEREWLSGFERREDPLVRAVRRRLARFRLGGAL
jgi:hypothetical protein